MNRGATLIELLLVLAILSGLLLIVALLPRGARDRADSRVVAELVAEELRLARQRARAEGSPVAVVFPSQGGTSPVCQSLYHLQGRLHPDAVHVRDYSSEHPTAWIFCGYWAGPTHANGLTPLAANLGGFSLPSWDPPEPEDWSVVFVPSGAAVSSLPSFDGAVHLVVAQRLDFGSGSVGSRNSYRLTGTSDAYTVSVTGLGEVSVKSGVPGATGLGAGSPVASGPAPFRRGRTNQAPRLEPIEIQPHPNPAALPPGVDATVKEGGYLTFVVEAEDPDGDELLCLWSARGDEGGFSAPHQTRMSWDAASQRWRSVWEWTPPQNAAGQRFVLEAEVRDRHGGVTTGRVGASGTIEVLGDGRIYFYSQRDGDNEIYVMNADGTDATNLTENPADDRVPRPSPDGALLTFVSDRSGVFEIYLMNPDGSGVTRLTDSAALGMTEVLCCCWSPDGSQIAFIAQNGGVTDLFITNADGTDPDNPATPGARRLTSGWLAWRVNFRPDGQRLAVAGLDWNLYEVELDGTITDLRRTVGVNESEPVYSPHSNRMVWHSVVPNVVYIADYDPASSTLSNVTHLISGGAEYRSARFSPAGDAICMERGAAPNQEIIRMDLSGNNVVPLTTAATQNDDAEWAP